MRTVAYVDGFNFYNGALKGTDLKWIDLPALVEQVFGLGVDALRYFTARLRDTSGDPAKIDRQARFLQAIQADRRVSVIEGKLQTNRDWRPWVGASEVRVRPRAEMVKVKLVQEKGSDVNLAAHLLRDAYTAQAATALLVSGDGDLELPVRYAVDAGVDVRVLNPRPDRELSWATQVGVPVYELRRKKLLGALMPQFVPLADGNVVRCPEGWKHQTPPRGGAG